MQQIFNQSLYQGLYVTFLFFFCNQKLIRETTYPKEKPYTF